MDITDIRRLFRNRFEYYIVNNDSRCTGVRDGATVTLRHLCEMLEDDVEEFPSRFDPDMKMLCGHEHLTYFRGQRTYGDVARLLNRKLAGEDGRLPPVGGRWVHAVLKEAYQPSA
jgi:hypothetical protein